MSQRTERLDSQIQQELMQLLQRDLKDPRVGFATITRVETSRDLGHARVWVSVYGTDAEQAASIEALSSATPWLRRRLGERLRLRHVPQLSIRSTNPWSKATSLMRISGMSWPLRAISPSRVISRLVVMV